MQIKYTRHIALCITLGGLLAYVLLSSNSGGITGRSTVGCGGGGCHGNNSTSTIVSFSGVPGTGWTASTAYTITVTVTNTTKSAAGFDLTVSAGALSGASSGATASGTEARHTAPKSFTTGTASWTVTWTAPATGSTVTFDLAGNAVNLNSSADAGDLWNTATQTFNAASSVSSPTVTLGTPTLITGTSAKLNATVKANGASTAVTCAYGITTSYGSSATVSPSPVTGTAATSVSASLSGLVANTTYHYRFSGTNSSGTTASSDGTFKTSGLSVANLTAGGFKSYPNPVRDVLIIEAGVTAVPVQFAISDVTGKVMSAQVWRDGNNYNIGTSVLPAGLYILRIQSEGKTYGASFVKE